MVRQWQRNVYFAGCFGPETAEKLKKPAQPIVCRVFLLLFVPHHQLQYKGRKLAKADN